MRNLSVGLLVVLGFGVVWPNVTLSFEDPCPLTTKGSHRSGPYKFGFQSWSWGESGSHVICHCVRNYHNSRALFIDWEETGIKGYVLTEDTAYSCTPYDRPGLAPADRPLWFGISPLRKDVPTVRPQMSVNPGNGGLEHPPFGGVSTLLKLAAARSSEYGGGETKNIISRSKIAVPIPQGNRLGQFPEGAKLVQLAEENPRILKNFEMAFYSQASIEPESGYVTAVKNNCTYILTGGNTEVWRYEFLMKFEDEDLHAQMFDDENPVRIKAYPNEIIEISGQINFDNNLGIKDEDLVTRSTKLLIMMPETGEVVGTLPVAYLAKK